MAISVFTSVFCVLPCENTFVVASIPTPKPIEKSFCPPSPFLYGEVAMSLICESISTKEALEYLKPTVLTLAILLLSTSSAI